MDAYLGSLDTDECMSVFDIADRLEIGDEYSLLAPSIKPLSKGNFRVVKRTDDGASMESTIEATGPGGPEYNYTLTLDREDEIAYHAHGTPGNEQGTSDVSYIELRSGKRPE